MAPGIDNEKRWAFLKPWTKVLKHQLRFPRQPNLTAVCAFVIAPTQERGQKIQEGLKLLAAVAHVDYDAWMYLLEKHCKLKREESWDGVIEKEMLVGFQLEIESPHFVQMWGIQQHDRPSPEYSEALARIAAMDQNLHTKECGVEIPVLLEPFVKVLGPKDLDKLSRLHNAVKTIRREWEEESLSFVAAGTFRCTFVLSVTNANLSRYYPIDLDMVKKMEELVHDNVWFSRISIHFLNFAHFRNRRQWREMLGRILRSLFDSTRCMNEAPTRFLETERDSTMARQQLEISLCDLSLNEMGAFCSAVMHSQTVRVLELLYVGSCWRSKRWWEWLAYGFFSKKAQSLSSLESLALRHIESMKTSQVKAFHEILSSEYYEEALLGYSGGSGGAQYATLAANSPIRWFDDKQNEPVLGSELKSATPISFLRMKSESEWIDAIVPGYGRCQIRREDLVLSEHVNVLPANNLKTLEIHFAGDEHSIETVDISGLPLFLTAVGSFLKKLTIDTGTEGIVVDVKMVLNRCPNLERLCLKTNHDIAVLDFSEYQAAGSTLPDIIFNLGDIPAFTEELMNTDSALSNCLQGLTIRMDYPYRPRDQREGIPEHRRKFETVLKILERNERLEYLHIKLYDEYIEEYTERFRKFHLRPTKHSAKLDFQRKIALLSVVSTAIPPRSDKMKRERYMGKKPMNWDQLGADAMTIIFLFAATPVRLRVYVGGLG